MNPIWPYKPSHCNILLNIYEGDCKLPPIDPSYTIKNIRVLETHLFLELELRQINWRNVLIGAVCILLALCLPC